MKSLLDPAIALARALVLAPLYFALLTLFGLWPWRFGSPYFLLGPFGIPREARRTFVLRACTHRLLLRDERLLRANGRWFLDPYRLRRWLRSPWFVTVRSCARFTRAEMKRSGLSGVSTALTIYGNAVVDSYRFANGTVHRDWFDQERRPDGAFHLPNEHHIRVCCYLLNHKSNPDMPIAQRHHDKIELHRRCQAHDLPTVPVYASFEAGHCTHEAPVPDEALISKPRDLAEGNGVFTAWTPLPRDDEPGPRSFRSGEGEVRTLDEILSELTRLSNESPYLLQRRVFNHSQVRALAGTDTLCSLRIPTCRFPDGRVEALPFCFVRMPTLAQAITDNMTRGSIAFPVDLETGQLKTAGKFGTSETFDVHPTSGERVTGVELAFWRESLELCREAHRSVFSTFPTVGWDVAITEQGPLLLEMNIQWVRPVGLPGELFSGQTPYVDCILAHIERFWPEQLPPAST